VVCVAGETTLEDGSCQPAGVPAGRCGEGFAPDDSGGCQAIMPPEPCQAGSIAVPGDTTCREIAPCGDGTWGNIADEAGAEYVDGTATNAGADGTREHPWPTIAEAIEAAEPGALVAVAAGTYHETVEMFGKGVRLEGRCPSMVEVAGDGSTLWSVLVGKNADGASVRNLAITGAQVGLVATGAKGVLVERTWIHDTGDVGIGVAYGQGPAEVTFRECLVEATRNGGMVTARGEVTIERSVFRAASGGWALEAAEQQGAVTIESSVFEDNAGAALVSIGANMTVEATLVRRTSSIGGDFTGLGVVAQADYGKTEARGSLVMRGSVVEDNGGIGVLVDGADLTLDATSVRRTLPADDGLFGVGVLVKRGGTATIGDCAVDGNRQEGVAIFGSSVAIESTIVRGTQPNGAGAFGDGIGATIDPATSAPSTVTVRRSRIEGNHTAGLNMIGSHLEVEATAIVGTLPSPATGDLGRGVNVQSEPLTGARADATLRACLVDGNGEAGVVVLDADVVIEDTRISNSIPTSDGRFGDGVVVVGQGGPASIALRRSSIDSNPRAGLLNVAATASLLESAFSCNGFDLEGASIGSATYGFQAESTECGCPAGASECQVLTSDLAPPPALPSL
jgi:hypothetical protein